MAEVYLIRAEARAQQSKIDLARDDVNAIRSRANVADVTTENVEELLVFIALERERELFAEFGHRWFDLKRRGEADAVLGALEDKEWTTSDQWFPIPQSAVKSNPNLN
ncbi:RagB/SusD family nutrient uptake outer membrane protein [Fulvivirga maritima]|nr:RagB/SusD family nutrient uptake outer membrane protein [Fulvivirga maritima]UII24721.1 RagB/SusD family nutrient uptake outer membrane protein [Fulvivirga maritima]